MKKKVVVYKPLDVLKKRILMEACGKASTRIDLNRVKHNWNTTLEERMIKSE